MRKTLLSIVLVLAMLTVLAACGNNNKANTNTEDNAKVPANDGAKVEEPAAEVAEDVTINFMHLWPAGGSPTQNQIVKKIIEEYQTANTNVTIKTEELENEQYKNKLKVLSASNQLPDIGVTWAAGFLEPYVKGKRFAPLDDMLQGNLNGKFVAGTTDAYAIDGVTYALPLELNIVPVYYNKELFANNNLEVPQTYAEFKNVVKTLSDNGVAPIALGNKDRWTGSLWYMYLADRFGGPETLKSAIDRSGTFEDPALIDAAKEIQELVKMNGFNKGFNGLSNDEGKAEFMNEQAAMYMMGTWELPNYTTNPDVAQEFKDKIGFFKFPTIDGGKGDLNSWVGGPGVGLFVSEDSKVKDEAKKFVEFFVEKWGEHSITEAGVIPATKVDTSTIELNQMYIDLLNELSNASNLTLFADVQMKPVAAETHLNMIQALFGNAVTPEEFAKKHEEALSAGK